MIVLYLALAFSGLDAGQHEIITHHLEPTARACEAGLNIYRSQHPDDNRTFVCIAVRQIDVTPHE